MVLGKLDSCVQNNQTRLVSHTIYKNKFKWIKGLNVRPKTIKILEEKKKHQQSALWHQALEYFFLKRNISKYRQMELQQTKRLLHRERNYQQNKKAPYWMGEDICKKYIW